MKASSPSRAQTDQGPDEPVPAPPLEGAGGVGVGVADPVAVPVVDVAADVPCGACVVIVPSPTVCSGSMPEVFYSQTREQWAIP